MSEAAPEPRRPRRRGRGLFALFLLAAFAGGWTALWGVVELGEDEVALVSRAGRVVRQLDGPGRHVHLPFPLERRSLVSLSPRALPEGRIHIVTRDTQLLEVAYGGTFRVQDARAARFGLQAPVEAATAAIVGALAAVAATQDYASFRTGHGGAARLSAAARREADARLSDLGTGLGLTTLDLEVGVPSAIAELDAELETLRGARDEAAREARQEGEALLAEARLRALEVSTQARLERDAQVSRASGEAERFRALAAEYRRAPDVVRTRIYLETMEAILGNARLVIADPGAPLPPTAAPPARGAPAPEVSSGPVREEPVP